MSRSALHATALNPDRMTYTEAIQFLYRLRWFGAKFGLANTLKLAALADRKNVV